MSLVVVTYAAVAAGNLLLRAAGQSAVPGYLTPSAGVIERIVARTKDRSESKRREDAIKGMLATQEFAEADEGDVKAADEAVARVLGSVPADERVPAAILDIDALKGLLKERADEAEAKLLNSAAQAAFRTILGAAVQYAAKTARESPDLSKIAHQQELRDLAELSDEVRALSERLDQIPAETVRLLAGGKVLDLQRTVPSTRKIEQPSRLLVPTSGVFPFVDRGGLLEDLVTWADDPSAFSVRILGGSGGSGKSRLAVELCRVLLARGDFWKAGFLHSDVSRFPAALGVLTTFPGGRLIVMDYAETRTVDVAEVLETLPESATFLGPVRVLLLVRNPSDTPDSPGDTKPWVDAVRATRREDANQLLDEASCALLDAAPFRATERAALFRKALDQLPPYLGLPATSASTTVDTAFLEQPEFDQPLSVVMAAYLQLVGSLNVTEGSTGLFEGVLEHEAEYWRSQARQSNLGLTEPELRLLVALATLTDAIDDNEARTLLSQVSFLSGDANALSRERAQSWLRQLYPGQGSSQWGQFLPDRLGEYLVAKELASRSELVAAAIDAKRSPIQWVRPFTVLARTCADDAGLASAAIPLVNRLLPAWCEQCHGLANAQEDPWTSSPVIEALAVLTEALGRHCEVKCLIRISGLLGLGNPLLARLALAIDYASVEATESEPNRPDRGAALNNYAVSLAEVGRREEAVEPALEAVTLYQALANTNPAAYNPNLAMALNNYAVRLAEVGRRDEAAEPAREAVTLYQALANTNPAAYNPNLAMSLNNYAVSLAEVGRREEALEPALEAVTLGRELAKAMPAAYARQLVRSLKTLAGLLEATGSVEDAETLRAEADTWRPPEDTAG
ncbi:MAG: tetratricopeptide repeat protein [Arachnia sp.]